MPDIRTAVISDIHGNADALDITLDVIKSNNVDMTIVLGDLLTYGCQPCEVIDKLIQFQINNDCIFIKGNHDQFYFSKHNGQVNSNYEIPSFIQESIDWTADQIKNTDLASIFTWHDNFKIEKVYFAHANPYDYGDWSYVDKIEQCITAAETLRSKGYGVGVFGHVHRNKALAIDKSGNARFTGNCASSTSYKETFILNPGTVGQPRGEGCSFMFLNIDQNEISYSFSGLHVDMTNSIKLINETKMSIHTKNKIASYLKG